MRFRPRRVEDAALGRRPWDADGAAPALPPLRLDDPPELPDPLPWREAPAYAPPEERSRRPPPPPLLRPPPPRPSPRPPRPRLSPPNEPDPPPSRDGEGLAW